jgi:serine protease AprX
MSFSSLRDFLHVPEILTGKGVRIAIVDGDFPTHPDITTNSEREVFLVRASDPDPSPVLFQSTEGQWRNGAHGLCAAAAAAGSGELCNGLYQGVAPQADLFLVAGWSPGGGTDSKKNTECALRWIKMNWQHYEIRGVLVAVRTGYDAGLLPWQTDSIRILCEELTHAGLFVVSGTGNNHDLTAMTQAASPSVLSVGGVIVPTDGDPRKAVAYHGCRGVTFEGKHVPEILAPAENLVLPLGTDAELLNHLYAGVDVLPTGYARIEGTSYAGPMLLGAAACVWQAHPNWGAQQVRSALTHTSLTVPGSESLGAGLVWIKDAIVSSPDDSGSSESAFATWNAWRNTSVQDRLSGLEMAEADVIEQILLSFLPDPLPANAIETVRDQLSHPWDHVRAAALCALASRVSTLSSTEVFPMLRDISPLVRMAAIEAIQVSHYLWEDSSPVLKDLFMDANFNVRYASLHLASLIKQPSLIPYIIEGLEEDAQQGRVSNFGQRVIALKSITGKEMSWQTPYQLGECFYSEHCRNERIQVARRWQTWWNQERKNQ